MSDEDRIKKHSLILDFVSAFDSYIKAEKRMKNIAREILKLHGA